MDLTKRKMIKQSRSRQLHERADFCRHLALGVGDRRFAAKLQVLVDEYEGEAARITRSMEPPVTARESGTGA